MEKDQIAWSSALFAQEKRVLLQSLPGKHALRMTDWSRAEQYSAC